ncbi:hypothetical protein GCM10010451_65740 [Streptomyces virens]|uniref:Translation initiation factor IF-2 n=1 Tax=Streptomyces virens TaxID=285572 RepID=A0ABP6Q8P9_9ACTN
MRVEKWREDAQPERPESAEPDGWFPQNASHPAVPRDRAERSGSPADDPWDAERTTALRIPRPRTGLPGTGAPGPAAEDGARGAAGGHPGPVGSPNRTPWAAAAHPGAPGTPAPAPRTANRFPTDRFPTASAPTNRFPAASVPTDRLPAASAPTSPLPMPPSPTPPSPTAPFPTSYAPTSYAPTSPSPADVRVPVRDPWREADAEDVVAARTDAEDVVATHDPHEVTVQLDAVRIGDGGVLRRSPGGPGGAGPDGSGGGPVFVDESGRRIQLYRRIGIAVGLACAGYAAVMVATLLSGNSDAPWMPVPGQEQKPAGQVEPTPQPARTDTVPGATLAPDATPTTTAPALPASGATVPATGATGATEATGDPDAAGPATTPARSETRPVTGGDGTTSTTPDTIATTRSVGPDPLTTAPTGGGDAAGTDDRAAAPRAVAVEDPAAPSPGNVL